MCFVAHKGMNECIMSRMGKRRDKLQKDSLNKQVINIQEP